ncbi:MAG: tetraacyldisaccharide 4'-kinase [Victivallaceae bacterium]|nr:tetraacyldisaccharide 4'-kinase [Victivallaceae bacterium]
MRSLLEKLEQYFLPFILGRPQARARDVAITSGLFVASRFYRMVTQFRIWLYDRRFFRYHALGCLVVSIGNLSCGGTGKTPVVEVFARSLRQKGRKVAILSRGYRSRKRSFFEKLRDRGGTEEETPPKVVSDGERVLLNSDYAGDEPFMLASNLPGVVVLVDKDRVKSGLYAIDKFQTDTLILDDGFQYLRLRPHINIVLVDATSPFGNHHVLPRGILREPIKNIRRADYVFLTKSSGGHRNQHLHRFIRRHNRRAEIIECCHMPQYLASVFDHGHRRELSFLKHKAVAALSGIANPASFEKFLEDFGAKVVYTEHYADHHRYSVGEIERFAAAARKAGAELLLTTEKDAVRIPHVQGKIPEFDFLRIQIDILSGKENFEQCISRICFL